MAFPKKEQKIKWFAYLRSFYPNAWYALIIHVLVTAIFICLISLATRDFVDSKFFSLTATKALIFSMLSTLAKRFPFEPNSSACRIAFVTISFAGFIFISLYRAMLGASLAITIEKKPVNSLSEVLLTDYMIGTMAGTSLESYFTRADKASTLYAISQKKLLVLKSEPNISMEDEPKNVFINFLRNYNGILIFWMDDVPYLYQGAACTFSRIDRNYMAHGLGFVFQKNWPYTKLMNNYILRLIEDGTIEHLKRKWLHKDIYCESEQVEPSNLLDTFTLYATLVIGGLVAFVLFLLELLNYRCS